MKYNEQHFEKFNSTFVYVIESTSGHFKIGISDNPARRIKQLNKTKGPFDLNLIYWCAYDSRETAAKREQALHGEFEHARVNGEWFKLSAKDLMDLGYSLGYDIVMGIAGPSRES